ncbi:MAG TPA: class I SAM-dependent methyltransferase [Sphingomicrobium sp.]|nr:class I SAM-dependent methyltransferase [Sphingomicrobium sp.]
MRLSTTQGFRPRKAEGIAVPVKQCSVCALIYADPLPIPDSLEDHYGLAAEHYWRDAGHWTLTHDYFADEIAHARELLRDQITALDVGVGLGKAMAAMRNHGFDVRGIEPSATFRELAIKSMGLPPDQVIHAAVETAEFEQNSFDFVSFGAVLEHIYDPSAALQRALYWLRPGGIIHAEVPFAGYFFAKIINLFYRVRGTNYVTNISPMHSPFHLYEFTLKSFQENGRRIGYEVARSEIKAFTVLHLPKVLHPPLEWWMRLTRSGMQLTVYLRKLA